jgi:hypothetical protein
MFEETRYGNALAAGTLVIALIDTLIDKGLITRSNAQGVLTDARSLTVRRGWSACRVPINSRPVVTAVFTRRCLHRLDTGHAVGGAFDPEQP